MLLLFIFIIIPACVLIAIPLGIAKAKQDARAKLVQEQILKNMTTKA